MKPERFERDHWAIHQGMGHCRICDKVQAWFDSVTEQIHDQANRDEE